MIFIVATPIGNLQDLSIRQAKTILEAEILLTEDTRTTGILLERIKEFFAFERNPKQKLISYYKDNEFEKLPQVLDIIQTNPDLSLALISQSGMPLVNDPGLLLVKQLIKNNVQFTVVPGPSAGLTALVSSGFDPQPHMFVGFLPKKKNDKLKLFRKLRDLSNIEKELSFVCYESPLRMDETVSILAQQYPDSNLCVCRELTKKFEEICRGNPKDLLAKNWKGEIVLIIQFQS